MKQVKKVVYTMLLTIAIALVCPSIIPHDVTTVTAAKPKISKDYLQLTKGQTYRININNTKKKVKWSTSSNYVATVNSKGKITAKRKGMALVRAKIGSKTYTCKVLVYSKNDKYSDSDWAVLGGKLLKVTRYDPAVGKTSFYLLKLNKPTKFKTYYGNKKITEVQIKTTYNLKKYVNKNVIVAGQVWEGIGAYDFREMMLGDIAIY